MRELHQLIHARFVAMHAFEQLRPDVLQRLAGKLAIDVVGRLDQFAFAEAPVGVDHPVLHLAFVDDEDHEHAIGRQRQELDLPQRDLLLPRQRDDARHAADFGEQTRREFDEPRRRKVGIESVAQHLHAAATQRLHRQQTVDEESQSQVGGDFSGRRMRRCNESTRFEFGHDVANRRGADVDTGLRRERFRRNRRALREIVLDEHFQQARRAITDSVFWSLASLHDRKNAFTLIDTGT